MVESVIYFLIAVGVLALVIFLVIYVLRDVLGLPIPPKVIQILWVIVALLVILWLFQMVFSGGFHLPSFRPAG